MKMLVLTNTWPSPSEIFIKNLVDGILERGATVTVLCKKAKGPRSARTYGTNGVVHYFTSKNYLFTIIRLIFVLPFFLIMRPAAFFSLWSSLAVHHDFSTLLVPLAWFPVRNEHFDAIHCQFGYLGNMGLVLRKAGLVTGPVISSFRGSDISSYLRRKPAVYDLLKETGDLFLPVCTAFRDRLVSLGFPQHKIRVYHSAIDPDVFPFIAPETHVSGDVILFCAGRLVEKKGFSHAIEVLHELQKTGTRYRLIIAGNGPLEADLRRKAALEGVSEQVEFTGWIDQKTMSDRLRTASLFLATNVESRSGDTDGIPNIVKEAMATGVPVIAFDHPGLTELITDRQTGLLVPSKNVPMLAEAIIKLTGNDLRNRIALSARTVIEKEYSKGAQARYLEELIQEYLK